MTIPFPGLRIRVLPALLAVFLAAPLAHAADRPGVVIQVSDNDPAKWNLALNNANNLISALGGPDKVEVEIVAYGPGLAMLKDDSVVGERLGDASSHGIALSACSNTMRAQHVTEAELHAGVRTVSAGVLEIMQRQREGWSYIRP
ncbi:DsrE family protein [Cognatazoarcus halotolerans]|uniref:DsrE family protein n=1 Tax=Cognatazoarcus halotolerans TaxID=2686016 RepID=UPI00135BA64B|nr:DsrE family protein [Cognatazoarcus halotolerans]MCB1898716.1 DsrE family protein [Rhodocyclaceae bacterium]MCP5310464.1 DsrE family protein [Zoogloeaceae bacterium]